MIVFYKFFDYIRRKHIKQKDIIRDTGISSATLANMKSNKGISRYYGISGGKINV